MTTRSAFILRIFVTTVVVFTLWTLIAKWYALLVDSAVSGMIWNIGFYVERSSSVETSLLSPLIPFIILMIGTWGVEFIYRDRKLNYKLLLWFIFICLMLLGFTILGQYLAVYMAVSNTFSQAMLNMTSFFIATVPLLVPVVAWYSLSKEKLNQIMSKKAVK
jgi:drug/metabolite transporter (DMT)-like permease